jgi:HEAT repeat protein
MAKTANEMVMNRRTSDALGTFGLGRTPGLSVLLEDLASDRVAVRNYARYRLVAMGRDAVPALSEALRFGNVYARGQAARALGEIGDAAAAPALVKVLADDQFSVHAMAAEALIGLGKPGLRALLEALIDQPMSPKRQLGARVVLRAQARESWHEQTQAVLDALDSANPQADVPAAARRALEVLGPNKETP